MVSCGIEKPRPFETFKEAANDDETDIPELPASTLRITGFLFFSSSSQCAHFLCSHMPIKPVTVFAVSFDDMPITWSAMASASCSYTSPGVFTITFVCKRNDCALQVLLEAG